MKAKSLQLKVLVVISFWLMPQHALAIAQLRARKHRPRKPFALMLALITNSLMSFVLLIKVKKLHSLQPHPQLFCSKRRPDADILESVAPGSFTAGYHVALFTLASSVNA